MVGNTDISAGDQRMGRVASVFDLESGQFVEGLAIAAGRNGEP